LVPAGFITGLSAATLWTAHAQYTTQISTELGNFQSLLFFYLNVRTQLCKLLIIISSNLKIDKAKIENSSFETVLNRLFGIFFFFFYSTFITGNIMSSMIIGHGFPQLETS